MKNNSEMRTVLWDFDGVILNSNAVRDWGFEEIFKDFDTNSVGQLLTFHRQNGGLSRYVKIRYFFENVLGQSISQEQIQEYANMFSVLMCKELINPANLIADSVAFIKQNYSSYSFHIVSGSDQQELKFLCKELHIDQYFRSIHGSPTPKVQLVKELLEDHNCSKTETCLIGDSINDYEAADNNEIDFYGYNNEQLKAVSSSYIDIFENFKFD